MDDQINVQLIPNNRSSGSGRRMGDECLNFQTFVPALIAKKFFANSYIYIDLIISSDLDILYYQLTRQTAH